MADKEKKVLSLSDIVKKLNKEYNNNNLIIKSNIVPSYKRLASGMVGMDYPLYGGLPYGRLMVYVGLEHSGKTTAACAELAAYQRENPDKICIYVDVEHTLDLQFQALMNHIDLDKLYYFSPENMSGDQILEAILEMQEEMSEKIITNEDYEKELTKQLTKEIPLKRKVKQYGRTHH